MVASSSYHGTKAASSSQFVQLTFNSLSFDLLRWSLGASQKRPFNRLAAADNDLVF